MEVTQKKRANDTEKRLKNLTYGKKRGIKDISYHISRKFLKPGEARSKDFSPCSPGFTWKREREKVKEDRLHADLDLIDGGQLPEEVSLGNNAWFRLRFENPGDSERFTPALRFSVRGSSESEMSPIEGKPAVEAQCYKGGQPWAAFDHGHDLLYLTDEPEEGNTYDLLVEVGTTLLWGGLDVDEFFLEAAELVEVRRDVRNLYFSYKIFNQLRKNLPENSPNGRKILSKLSEASHEIPFGADDESVLSNGAIKAREVLKPLRELNSEISDFKLTTAGHAHVDTAWLWPWTETVRKSGRTFSTAAKLLEDNSGFAFLQSQPHIYEFIKNRYPGLFSRIKEKVESDNWEPVGATWIESDVNLSGGEALARQYLYGKRYFREEFGVDPRITFIPDVFGYSAALPGIARAADCPYFLTQKMSWSEVNDFPHHSFLWEGIDGSQLISHFPPADTYNGMSFGEPVEEVMKSARDFKEADDLDRAAYLIGWGDGGGGPNQEMVEQVRTMNEIDALPDLEFDELKGFFAELAEQKGKLEKWVGELYLERHRGTLTTQGKTKRQNRKLEFSLREAEIWSTSALVKESAVYPENELERAWKVLLFHQFHDILPGSSIGEVYQDAERDYGKAITDTKSLIQSARNKLVGKTEGLDTFMVFNSLSWEMDRLVEIDKPDAVSGDSAVILDKKHGEKKPAQVSHKDKERLIFNANSLPPLGGKPFEIMDEKSNSENVIEVSERVLENSRIRLELDDKGYISSLTDLESDREVLKGSGNQLISYRDLPTEFDAWELEGDIYDVSEEVPPPVSVSVLESGPVRGTIRQKREFGDSIIVQDIMIYPDSKRIDFETTVEWKEKNTLLKAHFPIAVHSREATYEIQYGHYTRPTHSNTSWDEARFEVPHQKWVDVSEYGYGAAVLNDSKYGVNVEDTNIGLSLLRAPKSPDPEADMGTHHFTYSLLPHQGDFREAGVIQQSYELNTTTETQPTEETETITPLARVDDDGVIIEAIKRSEDSDSAIVIRAYEAWGRQVQTRLELNFEPEKVMEVNLIEDEKRELKARGKEVEMEFSQFEIKTLKVSYQ